MIKLTKLKAAKIISTIFVPPTFTILVLPYLVFKYEYLLFQRWAAILIGLTFGFGIQIVTYFYFLRKNKIKSFNESNNKERIIPYLFQIVFYIIGFILLLLSDSIYLIVIFWFTYILNSLALIIINYKWKISSHSIGVAQHFALFFYLSFPLYWLFILLAILIGWARIELNVHDKYQIIAGLALGFILTYLQLNILL
ncbi:MAG: hypothetical protein CO128_04145 [Ignavibacteriales bacterium CG_4_9_14_3_um_filter_30_11]|nr:MAG: hypothetical protein CO128_04145 [Ignavibacteriales bacterium CG_4_9_14_3_um_filter_30_11]